ncbi:hypothetical protein AAIP42_002668 [Flavobacterium psychrophilum]|nr:hypothetical protein [Flavobacterium psychrophilum]
MNRTILYYPTIDIPTNNWLRHSLLYWDEVSSIVPTSWGGNSFLNLSAEIQYLMDEGQFRPIKPEDLITKSDNWEHFENFQKEFRDIVSYNQFRIFINRRQSNTKQRIHSNKVENNYRIHSNKIESNYRVHSNKTSDSIYSFLKELNLADRDGENEWINFEQNTALLYMSLLAKYLADIDSNQTTIGTDYINYEKFNFKRVSENDGFPVVSFNLNNVLPTPKPNVSFEKIIQFKKKRSDNLNHFKKNLSEFQSKIAKSKSQAEIKDNAMNFQETLLNGVNDLTAVLKDQRIDFGLKTLKSMINLKSPTMITAIGTAVASKSNLIDIPLNLGIIGIASMGALELTTNFIDNRNKQTAKLRESPFSYIYYANKYGIIERQR